MKRGPKVVVIGAGSYFFGKPVIYNMVNSPILRNGTLALVDLDQTVLDTMLSIAGRAKAHANAPLTIESSTDRLKVLKDADFVVLSFSYRNAYYREMDTRIAAKYGVTMCSSDTIGPGGIFRAMRELPEILRIAKDVGQYAPNAWLINFINPSSVMGIALMRHAPNVKSFALCDGNHEPYVRIGFLKDLGILPADAQTLPGDVAAKFKLIIAGVNHCTWVTECSFDGVDLMPKLRQKVAANAIAEYETRPSVKAKPRLNNNYAAELMDLYGAFPTAVSHTKEYVPFFQGYGKCPVTPEPIIAFDGYNRAEEMAEAWAETVKIADGTTPIAEFFKSGRGDHATDIIESMWGDLKKCFYINGANQGAVGNLPADAFLELRCELDMNGPRPLPAGVMPRGLLGLTMQVLDTHELTVEAIVKCDRQLLLRAMMTDPIVNNINDGKNIIAELLELQRDHLDPKWFETTK